MNPPGANHDCTMTEEKRSNESLRGALHEVLEGSSLERAAKQHGVRVDALQEAILRLGSAMPGMNRSANRANRRRLTTEQESAIHALVRGHMPDALGGSDLLWSREAMRWLIEHETGMRFPDRTLAAYLERWGFAPEKPMRVLASRRPVQMREWLRRDLPVITLQSREASGIVYWIGAAGLVPRAVGLVQSKRGGNISPWIPETARILFLTTNRGLMHWAVHEGPPTHDQLIGLLERAHRMDPRKHFIIGHRHPLLLSDEFRNWACSKRSAFQFETVPID